MSPAIAAAIERATRATLLFDRAVLEANMRRFADAARASGVRVLFAAKSFPHREVYALAAECLDGFDVASPAELRDVPPSAITSIADPSGAALASPRAGRVIASCETVDQIRAAPPLAEIAIRISASLGGRDPAVGAVLEGSGRRRSRFGVESTTAAAELRAAAAGRRVGLHVHHGPVAAASGARFADTARAALELAGFAPAFINLGGAWHGVGDVRAAFAELRAMLPESIELLCEPGRAIADGAGFACGRVLTARSLDDRELRVTELSRICHLRWSHVELVAPPPRPGHGHSILVVGPTCFEEDVVGEWTIEPAHVASRIVLRGVTGYALAWNSGFAGVPPADVVLV